MRQCAVPTGPGPGPGDNLNGRSPPHRAPHPPIPPGPEDEGARWVPVRHGPHHIHRGGPRRPGPQPRPPADPGSGRAVRATGKSPARPSTPSGPGRGPELGRAGGPNWPGPGGPNGPGQVARTGPGDLAAAGNRSSGPGPYREPELFTELARYGLRVRGAATTSPVRSPGMRWRCPANSLPPGSRSGSAGRSPGT